MGDDPLDRLLVPVHGEGDALMEKGAGHTLLKARNLLLGHPLHFVDKELVVRARLPCGLKGFVEKLRVKLVVPKERGGGVVVSAELHFRHITRSHGDNATLSAMIGKTVGIIVKFDRAIRIDTNTRPLTLQLFFRCPWPLPIRGVGKTAASETGRRPPGVSGIRSQRRLV